jgi:hypothetical protein
MLANVAVGSLADIAAYLGDARFTPKSRHSPHELPCLLCANSGHGDLFDHLVGLTADFSL